MKRFLSGAVLLGLLAMPAMPALAGVTVTPMKGTMGSPFNNGSVIGFGWNAATGGPAAGGHFLLTLYDSILTVNGGAATAGVFGPFGAFGVQAFLDWTETAAQWGDELHGLPAGAIITSVRYGYSNTVATATHIIQIYDMVPPSATHPTFATGQFGALLASIVIPGQPFGTVGRIVTVTGLSIFAGTAAWIKFGEQGAGFPATFWLTGGIANGVGTSHDGVLYSIKDAYGPGVPLQNWYGLPYFYLTGFGHVGANIQVALTGVVPAPAAISLLGLAGLLTLRRRRSR